MKKYLSVVVVAGLILSFSLASTLRAEENVRVKRPNPFANEVREARKEKIETFRTEMQKEREEFRNNLKTSRDAFRQEVKARKEEFRSTNAEGKAKFCKAAQNMIGQRLDSAVKNLEKLQTRLEAVIAKLKEAGKDTTLAEEALALSKTKLSTAKEKVNGLKELIPAPCEGITPENFEQVKLLAREAKDSLKEVQTTLRQAIQALKDLNETEEGSEN